MPRALLLLLLLLAGGCPGPQQPRAAPTPFAMIEASPDLDGKVVGASEARATIVVVMASWCSHCRALLRQLDALRTTHPGTRILGVNYRGHEEYDNRGNAVQLRSYLTANVPWLRVVPADDALFGALGRPPFVPAVFVYDHAGTLVTEFDRRQRAPPESAELDAVLRRLGG